MKKIIVILFLFLFNQFSYCQDKKELEEFFEINYLDFEDDNKLVEADFCITKI